MTRIPSTRWKGTRVAADMSPWLVEKIELLRDRFRREFAGTDYVLICGLNGGVVDEDSREGRTCDRCRVYSPNIWRHRYTLVHEGYEMWIEAKFCTSCAKGEGFPVERPRNAFGLPS